MAINYQNFAGGPQQSRRLMELGAVRQQNAKNRQLNFLARMSDPKAPGGPRDQFSLQGLGGGPVRFSSVFGPIRQGTDLDDQAAIMEEAQRQRAFEDARRSSGQSARLQQIRSPEFQARLYANKITNPATGGGPRSSVPIPGWKEYSSSFQPVGPSGLPAGQKQYQYQYWSPLPPGMVSRRRR